MWGVHKVLGIRYSQSTRKCQHCSNKTRTKSGQIAIPSQDTYDSEGGSNLARVPAITRLLFAGHSGVDKHPPAASAGRQGRTALSVEQCILMHCSACETPGWKFIVRWHSNTCTTAQTQVRFHKAFLQCSPTHIHRWWTKKMETPM